MSSLWAHPAQALLEAAASPDATPGGGATAAITGAFGAALLGMAVGITQQKGDHAALAEVLEEVTALRGQLQGMADEDVQAFGTYVEAQHLPKEDPGRSAALRTAGEAAMVVPLALARAVVGGLARAPELAAQVHPEVVSDVGAGASLLRGALDAALLTVQINLPHVPASKRGAIQAEHDRLRAQGTQAAQATLDTCHKRLGGK
ncbi:cyclodeaminase/cyclohydrolase family protein [Deinococcus arcticus]|uniref:Methenyltetrahydrofolate cyclohydrolase n=1 Tax=Deinococcus arcticus TaxID=2136176 RepID=A0A2T3WD49_9DEIO|nr:cyclodeaminase/cyclohydrolase family protein [Deinococcus arcticus]PTA69762.1 methenyltetrahydrofolate cyclohydrolase [Deinococcus arcticus]